MSNRVVELDILRGLAIIGVILIHITSTVIDASAFGTFTSNAAIFMNQITRYAVPVFFILSGWGLTVSKKYNQNYGTFIKTQLSKIILFYVIWNIIYYVAVNRTFDVLEIAKSILLGSSYYHLYYVPLIIALYLIYPILYKYFKSSLGVFVLLVITVISQLADFFTGIQIFNNALNIFNWVVYFAVGIWLAAKFKDKVAMLKNNRRLIISLFVLISIVVFYESYVTFDMLGKSLATTSMRPSIIILSIIFVAFVIAINWSNLFLVNVTLKLATASYGIYLSHALILTIFQMVWLKLGLSLGSIVFVVSAFLIVTPVSYLISILMDRFEGHVKNAFSRAKLVGANRT